MLACLVPWYYVNAHLSSNCIIPPIQFVECFQKKYFVISFDIHKSPLRETQQEPTFTDELRHRAWFLESGIYGAFALNASALWRQLGAAKCDTQPLLGRSLQSCQEEKLCTII